ncbi:hypothetical protein [Paraburkholderia lycopersici]|uniref:Uncharacterized protein n=1 Tax=Paraburkholderia lycopersici TaxID=416944 RepID=A0A1G6TFK1_9BURK|nr:hypothetical protein [Paraburkholderia lycopersici]SDD27831.1 hypothetical protein SAMN05421548_11723 [Paraburkholderia lycopersici]
MSYSLDYKGYLIDHTPFVVERDVFGAQWTVRRYGGPIAELPFSSGDLGCRGAAELMSEIAKRAAMKWLDRVDRQDATSRNLMADWQHRDRTFPPHA